MVDIRHFEYFIGSGSPVPGAVVEIKVASLTQPNPNAVIASTTTNANGMWQVLGLAANDYDVLVTYSGRVRKRFGLSVSPLGFDLTDSDIAAGADIALSKLDGGTGLLSDSLVPASITYNTMIDRVNGILSQIKAGFGGASWSTAPVNTIVGLNALVTRAEVNQLVNPGFEIWQRGNGPFTATLAYGPDRWQLQVTTSTVSVSKETTIKDIGSAASAAITYTHAGGGFALLRQSPDGLALFSGQTVTFRARVRSNVVGAVALIIRDSAGAMGSTSNTTTGAFETLTVTRTITDPAASLTFEIVLSVASAVVYVDNASVVFGSSSYSVNPLPAADDLARCLRYYQKFGGVLAHAPWAIGFSTTGMSRFWIPLNPAMGGTPTIVQPAVAKLEVLAHGYTAVATALASGNVTPNGFGEDVTQASAVAREAAWLASVDTTGFITAEWNP